MPCSYRTANICNVYLKALIVLKNPTWAVCEPLPNLKLLQTDGRPIFITFESSGKN